MLVNVIIPVCKNVANNDHEYRLLNLNAILSRSLAIQVGVSIRVIIVEQITNGTEPFFLPRINRPKGLEIVTAKVQYPVFVKGWLYNVGERLVVGNHVVFAEGDCISLEKNTFARLMAFPPQIPCQWAMGWERLYYTNLQETEAFFQKHAPLGFIRNNGIRPRIRKAEGGLVYFTRKFFHSLGGYSEWIKELGGPDNDIAFRARHFSGQYEICPGISIYHLYHPYIDVKTRRSRIENVKKLQDLYNNAQVLCRAFRGLYEYVGKKRPLCDKISYWDWSRDIKSGRKFKGA